MSRQAAGFTLVEVSVLLVGLLVVLSIVVINVSDLNRLTRFARVQDEVTTLCSALARLILDTGDLVSHRISDLSSAPAGVPVGLLIGDGDEPTLNSQSPGPAGAPWLLAEGDPFEQPADYTGTIYRFTVDTLANHLLHNTPLGAPSRGYLTAAGNVGVTTVAGEPGVSGEQGTDNLFAWRGPYISGRVEADPWGNRYMANVFGLYVPSSADGGTFTSSVVCYSAGADGEVDTAFNQPTGWATGDDDVSACGAGGGGL